MKRFLSGFAFALTGWRALGQQPGLKKWAVVPLIIDLILLWIGLLIGFANVSTWSAAAVAQLLTPAAGVWYTLSYYLILVVFAVGFSIVVVYGVFVMAAVIASPFNMILAEKVLVSAQVLQRTETTPIAWIKTNMKMLKAALIKGIVFALIGIFIFGGSFIPVLNIFAAFVAFLVVSFDCMDYAFEAMEWPFHQRWTFFKSHQAEFFGMAAFLLMTGFIPGLTLLLLPVAVVGATQLFIQMR